MRLMVWMGCSAMLLSPVIKADMLGVRAGVDHWQAGPYIIGGDTAAAGPLTLNDAATQRWSARFEHPLPLLPNLAMQYQTITHSATAPLTQTIQLRQQNFQAGQSTAQQADMQHLDLTAYYELLDNPLFSLDLGLTVRKLDTDIELSSNLQHSRASAEVIVPMLFLDTEVGIWGTDTWLFAQTNYSRYQSDINYDWQAGISWRAVDIAMFQAYLRAGWRQEKQTLTNRDHLDFSLTDSGGFVGVAVDF